MSTLCLATLQENNNTRKPVPWFLTAAFCLLPSLLPRFCDSSLHCLLILPPRWRRGNEKGKSLPRTLHFASCTTHLLCCWLSYSLSACVCLCLYHLSLTTVGRPVFSRVGNTTSHSPRCPRRLVLPPSKFQRCETRPLLQHLQRQYIARGPSHEPPHFFRLCCLRRVSQRRFLFSSTLHSDFPILTCLKALSHASTTY